MSTNSTLNYIMLYCYAPINYTLELSGVVKSQSSVDDGSLQ